MDSYGSFHMAVMVKLCKVVQLSAVTELFKLNRRFNTLQRYPLVI